MGQQQLLLIVLGVIIVGIAVVVGINVFTASASSSNRDAITADLTNLAAMAQQYYRKPLALGGGGNSFLNFAIPASLQKTANMGTAGATISTPGTTTGIGFTAVGTENGTNGTSGVSVVVTVTPTGISTSISN
jgi:Tfp pilus assembly protein PilE